ncbi:MAG: OB-fold nucleic acid binding domain-containing protein [Candidatus Nanoarchaeia archaeon]
MDNDQLFNICLCLSLICLLMLSLYCEDLKYDEYSIKEINSKMLDQKVRISGTITSITETQGLYILNIKENSDKITVLIFKKEPLDLRKNSFVEVSGSVTEYQDQLEIIAKRIELK